MECFYGGALQLRATAPISTVFYSTNSYLASNLRQTSKKSAENAKFTKAKFKTIMVCRVSFFVKKRITPKIWAAPWPLPWQDSTLDRILWQCFKTGIYL